MRLSSIITLLAAAAGGSAWQNSLAYEFETHNCKGGLTGAHLSMKYWKIPMKNASNSVVTYTVNKGVFRWYAYSATTEDGHDCYGDVVGKLQEGCNDLDKFVSKGGQRIKCIMWCNSWASKDKKYSCAAIGQE
ncbi:Uu.00g043350.m01.CDS01 [Anthostomella pinea]|uniref:Uu.00g043350.m01.CDS01 n=1 Tax=Anthostomella pinea TaxID=933095 RepID=A0AAI8YE81_9PEZI|nr:Uu.00g043350.m01.CDS01 [Anthostomella pinea]